MSSSLTLLVRSPHGAATALADIAVRRARELHVPLDLIPLADSSRTDPFAPAANGFEAITAVVPVDFAAVQHEAWCLLCQLSLLRCDVDFTILVLGAESHEAFRARQRHLLQRVATPVSRRRHAASSSAA